MTRGDISTAATHGISMLTAPPGTLTGNPWMPPIPASTWKVNVHLGGAQ